MSERRIQASGRFAGRPYQSKQCEYAALYGKPDRTIRRWQEKGFPLDDPDAMGEYLSPRGRHQDEDEELPPPMPSGDEDEALPIQLGEDFFEGFGALAAIERLKKAERERAAAYFTAILKKSPAQVLLNRFREWTGIIEALRKLSKDEPDIRKANDLTIDKSEVEACVGHVFAAFRTAARNLPTRAAAKLLASRSREETVEILTTEVEILIRTLDETAASFANDTPPPAVEAEPVPEAAGELKVKAKRKKNRSTRRRKQSPRSGL